MMIAIEEQQLGWFLGCLMEDYEMLSELYKVRDEELGRTTSATWPRREVFLRSIGNEIETYKRLADEHRSALNAFLSACGAAGPDEQTAFEAWAADNLGQGYPLAMDEGTYQNAVTRWAFVAWKAGRRQLMEGK